VRQGVKVKDLEQGWQQWECYDPGLLKLAQELRLQAVGIFVFPSAWRRPRHWPIARTPLGWPRRRPVLGPGSPFVPPALRLQLIGGSEGAFLAWFILRLSVSICPDRPHLSRTFDWDPARCRWTWHYACGAGLRVPCGSSLHPTPCGHHCRNLFER